MLKLSDFDYALPKELIAQYPLIRRDKARLLVLDRATGKIKHCIFSDITGYLAPADLIVLNDTKVLPSRIEGRRATGGRVEVLLLKRKSRLSFEALIKPARLKLNEEIIFNNGKVAGVINGRNRITFLAKDPAMVYAHGRMPLPPYIKREPQDLDNRYYQTVYARRPGAVAAPTAGLHFSRGLIKKIESGKVNVAYITLHVGYGTFRPVKSEDITEHKMEPELFRIPGSTESLIRSTRLHKGRIFAVGTTSLRALEASAGRSGEGRTSLFIYPGYQFKMTDCLITNFHLPRTTLFMLVSAFAGAGLIKKAYRQAIEKKYRFYSYGDAMLIV